MHYSIAGDAHDRCCVAPWCSRSGNYSFSGVYPVSVDRATYSIIIVSVFFLVQLDSCHSRFIMCVGVGKYY